MPKKLSKNIALTEIAKHVGGQLKGPANAEVSGLCPIDEPLANHLAFLREKNPVRAAKAAGESGLKAFLLNNEAYSEAFPKDAAAILIPDPQRALIACVELFYEAYPTISGVSPKAEIDPSATIGKNVSIAAFCVVGAFAQVGDGVTLHPHVVIYPGASVGSRTVVHAHAVIREDCIVGEDSVIQNGAIIGADGFGFIPDPKVGLLSVPQVGSVKLAAKVDVGANACIDRAALGFTSIGMGSKLDNLVQIGHNTSIGKFSIICGQAGIAGSCEIGDQVVLGGNAGIADHIKVASGARFSAKAGVTGDITEKGDYGGHPAIPIGEWRRSVTKVRSLVRRKKGAPQE